MKKALGMVFPLALLLLIGCGDKVGLGGKVTFSDDDSPLTAGVVHFETDSFLARGTLRSDGTYVVGSHSEKDGIPPGSYRVYIAGATREIGQDRDGMPLTESLIDEKFAGAETSGLTVNVDASTRRYDIKVDRYVPKK